MRAVKRPEVGARPLAAARLGVPPPACGGEAGNQPEAATVALPVMPSPEQIADTVNRYISLVAKGSADDLVELFADDATVEDPVGGEVHIGRQAIHGFYSGLQTPRMWNGNASW